MKEYLYERPIVERILHGFRSDKKLLQIITGPRQVGKTTAAMQIADKWNGPVINATADSPLPPGPERIRSQYVTDSLIETVLAKDVLPLQTVAKPALLRNLFMLAVAHPAQILSYNKMLGQLQDAGNTTTLAHYVRLLESAFLISGLELFRQGISAKRGSSPKLISWNNSLINAIYGQPFEKTRQDYSRWGRLIENAVGAHLLNHLVGDLLFCFLLAKRGAGG